MLPDEKVIRRLLNKSLGDENLGKLFHELNPQQRLVNVIFDEVKLKQALRFVGGHITGHSSGSETLTTSALSLNQHVTTEAPNMFSELFQFRASMRNN